MILKQHLRRTSIASDIADTEKQIAALNLVEEVMPQTAIRRDDGEYDEWQRRKKRQYRRKSQKAFRWFPDSLTRTIIFAAALGHCQSIDNAQTPIESLVIFVALAVVNEAIFVEMALFYRHRSNPQEQAAEPQVHHVPQQQTRKLLVTNARADVDPDAVLSSMGVGLSPTPSPKYDAARQLQPQSARRDRKDRPAALHGEDRGEDRDPSSATDWYLVTTIVQCCIIIRFYVLTVIAYIANGFIRSVILAGTSDVVSALIVISMVIIVIRASGALTDFMYKTNPRIFFGYRAESDDADA